jgi:hypothetical protein
MPLLSPTHRYSAVIHISGIFRATEERTRTAWQDSSFISRLGLLPHVACTYTGLTSKSQQSHLELTLVAAARCNLIDKELT